MAKDLFHNEVRIALEKDGWQITHDPYRLRYGVADIYIDLAAEEAIAAEKQGRKIAVEIKSFFGGSAISQFHTALGQFLNYQIVLESEDRDRILYLAIPFETYEAFFRFEPVKTAIARFQVKLLVYKRGDRTMDRVEHYRQIVRTFLEEYAQESVSPNESVTAELVFDEKRDRYLLVHVGWQGARGIYGCPMQIDIIDSKVWLQHNATEVFVDQELISRGISEDDMILVECQELITG